MAALYGNVRIMGLPLLYKLANEEYGYKYR